MKTNSMVYILSVLVILDVLQYAYGFRGAVFEHVQQSHLVHSQDPHEIIRANLEFYGMAVKVAKTKGVEVIVFPEYGIFPPIHDRQRLKKFLEYVPDPRAQSNPCQEPNLYAQRPILHNLSCLAREHELLLVANMGDIQPCKGQKGCPKDGMFHFNTNVVFDQKGTILGKYHKEHLFAESAMDEPPLGKQDPTFNSSLGRFATFVCFDIIFQRIVEVSHWEGVKAVLFPTMWLNAEPLYNSIQHFQAWSIGNDVPLLAANIHWPGTFSIGSGIINGKTGALVYTFNPDGQSKLLIADMGRRSNFSVIYTINNNGSAEFMDDGKDVQNVCSQEVLGPSKDIYKDYRCRERDLSNFTFIKLTKDRDSISQCKDGFCCSLKYSAELVEDYFMGFNNGTFNAINVTSWPEENCFLARCDSLHNNSCRTFPTRSKTLFYYVHLEANFSTKYIYPTVMTSGMRLIPTSEWKFKQDEHLQTASITYKDDVGKKLLLVGFKARPYDRDPPYDGNYQGI